MARFKIVSVPRNTVDVKYINSEVARQVNAVYLIASNSTHLIWSLASMTDMGWVRLERSKFVAVSGKLIRLKDQR